MMAESDVEMVYRSLRSTAWFFYDNSRRLVLVSVCWFVCSLPLITIGPSTLGAYAAIASLRDGDRVNTAFVARNLRRNGLSAAFLSYLPVILLVIATLYIRQYLTTQSFETLVLSVVTIYATGYALLLLIPTYAELVQGENLEVAIRAAIRWTASHSLAAVTMGFLTIILFVVATLLTIALPLIFAGAAFSFHLELFSVSIVVSEDQSTETQTSGRTTVQPDGRD